MPSQSSPNNYISSETATESGPDVETESSKDEVIDETINP